MVPVEWPIAAPAADRPADTARRAGRARLSTVRRDFLLDPQLRLTEQERALMTAMLDTLVAEIADEIRAATTPAAANDGDGVALAAELRSSGLLDIPELIALLLRRAEQIQFADGVHARGPRRDARLVQAQLSDEHGPVSAAAMALILARGRRLDRFGQCRIEFDDVPRSAVEPLVHAVAAAIGRSRAGLHAALAAPAATLAARHQPDRSLDHLAAALVEALDAHQRLDDSWLLSAAEEGEGALLAHALARRAGVGSDDAHEALLAGHGGPFMLLLKLAGLSRESAARLLANLCDILGFDDPARELARFDRFGADDLQRARAAMNVPTAYRTALEALEGSHGQRPV